MCLHKCQLSRYTKTSTRCNKLESQSHGGREVSRGGRGVSRGGREVDSNPIIDVKATNCQTTLVTD